MRKLLLILSLVICSIFANGQNSFYKDAKGTFWINGNLVKASTALTSFDSKISPTRITVEINGVFHLLSVPISEIEDINSNPYVDWAHFYEDNNSFFSSDFETNLQDQYTPTIILPMVRELGSTTITANTIVGAYTIAVASSTNFIVGRHFRIINSLADRYYFGTILNVVGNTITLDTQFDFEYVTGSEATSSSVNMNVDGSITPVIFKLRTGHPSIPSAIDITRMIITCTTNSAVDLSKFGDLPARTMGLAFRRVDGTIYNIFNVKTNADIASIAYDFTPYSASNPSQGQDGFVSRLTFAGQNKMGVVLRIEKDDNLEMLVQDNNTGLLLLSVILEGHVVKP